MIPRTRLISGTPPTGGDAFTHPKTRTPEA